MSYAYIVPFTINYFSFMIFKKKKFLKKPLKINHEVLVMNEINKFSKLKR